MNVVQQQISCLVYRLFVIVYIEWVYNHTVHKFAIKRSLDSMLLLKTAIMKTNTAKIRYVEVLRHFECIHIQNLAPKYVKNQ